MTNPIGDLEEAGALFVVGSNTTDAHPIAALAIKRAVRERGATLIVANPRWIDLCRYATIWLRPRPGTDVALLNGLAKIILDEGLWAEEYVGGRTEGFAEWAASLARYTPELVAAITGVSADDLRRAARAYAKPRHGHSAVVYAMGITQHASGTNNVFALANLAMLTGNVGVRGGGVNPLRGQCNVQGSCDMGCLPDVLPGYQRVADPAVRARWEAAWGVQLPAEPGLALTEMMHAIDEGVLTAMYVFGENPVLSEGDASHVARSLPKLGFLVVQDLFLTETAKLADVVLPGATFAEKTGTFTNTERRVQLVRPAIPVQGEARPDWEIICDVARRVARRLGQDDARFAPGSPAEILAEMAASTPSYAGISHARLEIGGLQWPCPTADHPGTAVLHASRFTRGLGRFVPVDYLPPHELPDSEFPLLLTTGRLLYHYHTGSLTRRVEGLTKLAPDERAEINPVDATSLGLADGDPISVTSRRGAVRARARVSDRVPPGIVFMTFHFAESPTNVLTSAVLDPISKMQELKVCAVRVARQTG